MRTPIPITRSHLFLNTQAPPRKHTVVKPLGWGYQPFPLLFISSTTLRAVSPCDIRPKPVSFYWLQHLFRPNCQETLPFLRGSVGFIVFAFFFSLSVSQSLFNPDSHRIVVPPHTHLPQGPNSTPTSRAGKDSGDHSYSSFCCSFLSLLFKARSETAGAYL